MSYEPSPAQIALLAGRPISRLTLQRGAGCASCRGTGFRGRTGLFELVTITEELRVAIVRGATRVELRELAADAGMSPMRTDGWRKVESGITTVEEVLRVVQN
jgi:type II secretory ATPase GspE/PulE/Tfp pilus assembly ATPase PilB-like protein